MNSERASEQITRIVKSWPGVQAEHGERGEFSFTINGHEIGHLHGDRAAHFVFPKPIWVKLREEKRIDFHPIFPGKPGLASRPIVDQKDVDDVISLMRLNYERIVERSRAKVLDGTPRGLK
jgi:hypothetical protein